MATIPNHLLLAARAEAVSEQSRHEKQVKVAIQIVADTKRQGPLPQSFLNDLLIDWWQELTDPHSQKFRCRLFSGPHPLPAGTTCASLLPGISSRGMIRRNGALLLNLHPAFIAGVKEENRQWCMARLATLTLAQGAVSPFVEALVQAAGVNKLASFLKRQADSQQWDAVVGCCVGSSRAIAVPQLTNKQAKAEARSRRQHQRFKQQQRQLTVEPGFFTNADGTPSATLEGIAPGSSGVLITDQSQGPELLSALTGATNQVCLSWPIP